jgi:HK97 gp10 family phage protein
MISAKVSGYTVDMASLVDPINEKGILKGCIKLASQMKTLAPVDKGRLRNSIQWKTSLGEGGINDNSGDQESEKIDESPSSEYGYAGATANYAIYVEKGTKNTHAQPFAEPSVALVFNGASIDDLAKEYGKNLEEMSSRGKRTNF